MKSCLGNFYGHLAIFYWSHWTETTFESSLLVGKVFLPILYAESLWKPRPAPLLRGNAKQIVTIAFVGTHVHR